MCWPLRYFFRQPSVAIYSTRRSVVESLLYSVIALQYSRSHLLNVEEFRDLVDKLTDWKVRVNNFTVGDHRFFLQYTEEHESG